MKNILIKPQVRAAILAVLTIVIGILSSALGSWDKNQKYFVLKVILFCISGGLYLGLMIFYATYDVNHRKTVGVKERQIATFEDLIISIISLCETNAADISDCMHHITSDKKIDLSIWNFNKACKLVCDHIYRNVCKLGDSSKYGIAYVKLLEDHGAEDKIQMVAFANQSRHCPTIYMKERKFKGDGSVDTYYDSKIFRRGRSDTDIKMGINEVNSAFTYNDGQSQGNKYQLYIGIPVFCNSNKMIGLLEVVCMDESQLGCITRAEIDEITNKFLVPYANVFLLLNKMEKALLFGTQPMT